MFFIPRKFSLWTLCTLNFYAILQVIKIGFNNKITQRFKHFYLLKKKQKKSINYSKHECLWKQRQKMNANFVSCICNEFIIFSALSPK